MAKVDQKTRVVLEYTVDTLDDLKTTAEDIHTSATNYGEVTKFVAHIPGGEYNLDDLISF